MASNFLKSKKEVIFSPLFSILFLFLFLGMNSAHLQAQKISNYYTSYHQEDGILYYVFENKDFHNLKDKTPLLYDLTYHSAKDSITFNFTYHTKQPREIHQIKIYSDQSNQVYPVKKIFVEKEKKDWKHRYSTKIAFEDLKVFYQSSSSVIELMTVQNEILRYEVKSKKWKKQSSILSDILQIIELNK